MNLAALEYFREIVENKSISKVASVKHISQSALSQTIQKLEDEVGYQLLERSNKGVLPTDAGRVLFKYSGTILRIHDKMKEELISLSESVENLRINGYWSLVNYSLPCMLYKVKKTFPKYHFELRARSNTDSINDLINELADLSFVTEAPCDDRLSYKKIGREKIVLIANKDNTVPDEISVEELAKHEMILLQDNSFQIGDFLKERLKKSGVSFEKVPIMFGVDSIPAAKSSINNNLGICFLPYTSVKKEIYEKAFKIVNVQNFDLEHEIYLVVNKDYESLGGIRKIYDYFLEAGQREFC